jgi:AraC-like DNA-binding protein
MKSQSAEESFDTTDVAQIEDILSTTYTSMRIDAHGRPGGLRRTRSTLGPPVQLDRNRWTLDFDVTAGAPLGVLAIAFLRSGHASYRTDGRERRYGPGDVFLALPPDQPFTATIAHSVVEVAVVDPALLSEIADTAPGRTQEPVRLTGHEPVSAQAGQTWKTTGAYIRDSVLADPGAAVPPLLMASTINLLAALVLATFPNNALSDPTAADRRDAHPDTLRRAMAFVDEHAHEDITAADIAAAAYVSVRAVQLAFRRHLGVTPMEYLRRVRLEAAHRDLVAADPARTTVSAIAGRWGFINHGRFASSYRRAYGVRPRHTLAQD